LPCGSTARQIIEVVIMHPKFEQRTEPYRFACERCESAWTTSYEIRRVFDHAGEEHELFLINGAPVSSPRLGVLCPDCGHDPVIGRPERWAPSSPTPSPVHRAQRVAGAPLLVLRRDALGGGEVRVMLSTGTTRLVLRYGPGGLADETRGRLQSPVPVQVAGASGLYSGAHWTDAQARLVWERDGRWFELAGHTGQELLVEAANALMADLGALVGSGQAAGHGPRQP
jgi:hypothetical protein